MLLHISSTSRSLGFITPIQIFITLIQDKRKTLTSHARAHTNNKKVDIYGCSFESRFGRPKQVIKRVTQNEEIAKAGREISPWVFSAVENFFFIIVRVMLTCRLLFYRGILSHLPH